MRPNKITLIWIACLMALFSSPALLKAQNVAIKTNHINDIALSPHLGIQIGLKPKWTLELTGEVNFWQIKGRKWKHAFVRPEARYWFCQRFTGHFIGLHAIGGFYNFGNLDIPLNFLGSNFRNLKDNRYQGWAAGAGVDYGYAWPVHKHWNIEAVIGIGWMYTKYDEYPCAVCGTKKASHKPHNYFGLTRLGVNLEYLF